MIISPLIRWPNYSTTTGPTSGDYDKFYHPDGSKVQIRPDGEVTRVGPKIQNPDPNTKGFQPRIDQTGRRVGRDEPHNTGEFINK